MKLFSLLEAPKTPPERTMRFYPGNSYPGDFVISSQGLTSLVGVVPGHIVGSFRCNHNNLETLEDGPLKVDKDYNCSNNKLTSLRFAVTSAHNFDCATNLLTSLEDSPLREISGRFDCGSNKLTSLIGAPRIRGSFHCIHNLLSSLEGLDAIEVDNFFCDGNLLTSLKDIHLHIKSVGSMVSFAGNPIKSHILGLLKIKNLINVKFTNMDNGKMHALQTIINKHLRARRPSPDIFACQEELEEAGYEEYAKL